jgi:transcription-repair coupling factor (superfamily II helicase)
MSSPKSKNAADDAPPRAFPAAAADAEFCQPLELALRQGLECETQELSSSAAAWTAWALAGRTRRTVLIVADGPRTLEALVQDLHTLRPFADAALLHYPGWEALPEAGARINPDLAGDRLQTLLRLREPADTPRVVATDIQAVMLRTWKPEALAQSLLTLRRGEDHPLEAVTEHLAEHGYGFATEVLAKGEAAKRGGLLDLWPPDLAWPVRVEYFGDTVESIRHFDPATQRSLDPVDALRIAPVSDAAQPGGGDMADLFDFVPPDAVWLWLDPAQITHHAGIHEETLRDAGASHLGLTRDDVIARAARHPQIHLGASGRRLHVTELEVRPLDALPGMGDGNLLPDLLDQERMKIVSRLCHEAAQGDHVVFDLQPGDFVVHVDHGIGKYLGLHEIEFGGQRQEVLSLEYADGALCICPFPRPTCSAATSAWAAAARSCTPSAATLGAREGCAQQAVQDLAAQLLQTQARATRCPGTPSSPTPLAARVRGRLPVSGDARPGVAPSPT